MELVKLVVAIVLDGTSLPQVPEFELTVRATSEAKEIDAGLLAEDDRFDGVGMSTDLEPHPLLVV